MAHDSANEVVALEMTRIENGRNDAGTSFGHDVRMDDSFRPYGRQSGRGLTGGEITQRGLRSKSGQCHMVLLQ
jgi:hypothetical protein